MTAPELKPCPFCGGSNVGWELRETYSIDSSYAFFGCRDCDMGTDMADMGTTLHPDDVAAWNHRADLAAVQPAQVHNKIEAAAFSMWKAEADRAAPNVGKNRTPERFADASMAERDRWLSLAHAAMTALEPQPDPRDEVIKGLVEALEWQRDQPEAHPFMKLQADAAIAAAKAVQK